jgi:hypothetical protein
MIKTPEIPFSYGDLVSVTTAGAKIVLWFKDPTGIIRGIISDVTNPAAPVILKDEIVFKRKTEGRTRKSKLPPVGMAMETPPPAPRA